MNREALAELNSKQCHCGNAKAAGDAFCLSCYVHLTGEQKRVLFQWLQFKQYRGAYEDFIESCKQTISAAREAGVCGLFDRIA